MNKTSIAAILTLAAFTPGCNKSPGIASDSPQVQAEPFHGQVYRSFDGRTTLTLISEDECELNSGGTTLLCKYTKQSDALRVVVTAMGTNQVIYYRFTDQGIQDNNGAILLSPERYAAATEQARLAQERQQAMKREAEQKRLAEENRKKEAFDQEYQGFLAWLRAYFAEGKVLKGKWGAPRHSFSFTVSDVKINSPSPLQISLDVTGVLEWEGGPPRKDIPRKREAVHLKGSDLGAREIGHFGGFVYITYIDGGKEFSLVGAACQGYIQNNAFTHNIGYDNFELGADLQESANNQTPLAAETADQSGSDSAADKGDIFARAQAADRKMGTIYSSLRSRLTNSGKARLKEEQLRWLKFRAEQTGSEELLSQGMGADTAALRRFTELNEERASQLRTNLQSIR
jgi:uncharacterized protein YecT (DUF1311 family)